MDREIKKYLNDILCAIDEIESFIKNILVGMMCFVRPQYLSGPFR